MSRLTKLLKQLNEISLAPGIQQKQYLKQGKKVVGCFPAYVPGELVTAAGMVPMGIWGAGIEPYLAKTYVPSFCCPMMQSNLEMGLNGTLEGLSAVMIPALCDALRCITQNWAAGVADIPVLTVTYPQNRGGAGEQFLRSEYRILQSKLEEIAGKRIREEDLLETIALYNRHNQVMREFAHAANEHLDIITPPLRHGVMKSAWFMERGAHLAAVAEIVKELKALKPVEWNGKKVVLTGIISEPPELLAILWEYGIAVVGDDLAHESRQYRTDIPDGGDGLLRLAGQWPLRTCSLIHDIHKTRIKQMREMAEKEGAHGVVACLMKFCDPEEYDIPLINRTMAEQGIPVLHLEIDQQNGSTEQLRTRIQTFSEML